MTLTWELILGLTPGRELDALIAEHVFRLQPCTAWEYSGMMRIQACWMRTTKCPHGFDECYWIERPCEYSQNLAASMLVIDRMMETHDFRLSWEAPDFPPFGTMPSAIQKPEITACFTRRADQHGSTSRSPSMPLSICRAAMMRFLPDA